MNLCAFLLDKLILWPYGDVCMLPNLHHKPMPKFGAYHVSTKFSAEKELPAERMLDMFVYEFPVFW